MLTPILMQVLGHADEQGVGRTQYGAQIFHTNLRGGCLGVRM